MGQDKDKVKRPKTKDGADLESVVTKETTDPKALDPLKDGKTFLVREFSGHVPQENGEPSNYIKLSLDDGSGAKRILRVGGSNFCFENIETIIGDGKRFLIIERVNRAKTDSPMFAQLKVVER